MIKRRTVAPAIGPITLDEARINLEVEAGDQDAAIQRMLDSAVAIASDLMGRAIMTQTWELIVDSWDDLCKIPMGQTQNIASLEYRDADGNTQIVGPEFYELSGVGTDDAMIVFPSDKNFDSPSLYDVDPIALTWVCGWKTAPEVPKGITSAIHLMVRDEFDSTESTETINNLIRMHKLYV